MPAKVDRVLNAIQKSGKSKSSAIAIAKSNGLVKQKGAHLAPGPKMKKKYS
jgi:hypothetical protein